MKNIDFILSLIKDKNNREEFVRYIQTLNINTEDMDLEDIILCILDGPWFLVFTEKLLWNYFIENVISEGQELKTYRGLTLGKEFEGASGERVLDYIEERLVELVPTTSSLDGAIQHSEKGNGGICVVLECTGKYYKILKDIKISGKSEVIMYKPKIKIHSIK